MLRRRGCLTQPATDAYATLGQRLRPARTVRRDRLRTMTRALAVPVPGVPRLPDALYRAGGRWLFAPQIALLMAPVILAGLVLTLLHRHDFSLLGRPTVASAATLWLLTAAAITCHELGHALAIRHAGRRILAGRRGRAVHRQPGLLHQQLGYGHGPAAGAGDQCRRRPGRRLHPRRSRRAPCHRDRVDEHWAAVLPVCRADVRGRGGEPV